MLQLNKLLEYVTVVAAIVLILLFLLKRKYKKREFFIGVLSFIVFAFAAHSTGKDQLLLFVLFIVCSSMASWKKILKVSLGTIICSLVCIFNAVNSGVIQDYTYLHHEGVTAHSGGFVYYTTLPYIVMYAILIYLYLRGEKIKWIEVGVIFAISYEMYQYSTTKLTWYLSLGILVLEIILVKFDCIQIDNFVIRKVGPWLFPVIGLITILCCWFYKASSTFWFGLNVTLGNRLGLAQKAFAEYPITLFGQYIEMYGQADVAFGNVSYTKYFYIDSGYIYAILGYGVLFTLVVIFMYSYLIYYATKRNDKNLFIWLIIVLVFTVVNNTWVSLAVNPVLMCFPIVFRSRNSMEERDKI